MIDSATSASASALASASASAGSAQLQAAPQPSAAAIGALTAETQPALPTVGRGQDVQWARSWTELSNQMKTIDKETLRFADKLGQFDPSADPITTMATTMGEMVRFGGTMSQGVMRFTMVTGLVNNTSSAVNKLLTQQ